MDIKEIEENFNDLQKYSDTQFHTIADLNKQIAALKTENVSLQKMMEGNLPALEFNNGHLGISNEQLICETQICLLKNKALLQELNSEETRKFATFVDVLEKIRKSGKDEDMSVKKLSDADILKLVVDNGSTK